MDPDEIEVLLMVNTIGSRWKKTFSQSISTDKGRISIEKWDLESGEAKALFDNSYNSQLLTITIPRLEAIYLQRDDKRNEENKAQQLKGF